MKHTIKKMKFILYFCLATFLLNSCTEEREYLENSNRDLKFEQKPFKEMILLKDFNTAYQKVKSEKQKSIASRSALEDQFNFTIIEDQDVKILEIDDKKFYNLLIERDSLSASNFENLLIMVEKVNDSDVASAFIVKYETPDGYMKFDYGNEKDVTTLFSRYSLYCVTICITQCFEVIPNTDYAEPHAPSFNCNVHSMIRTDCATSCGGAGGTNYGMGNTTTNGILTGTGTQNTGSGSNSNNTANIVTAPVYGFTDIEEKTPCITLKKKSNENQFKIKFNNLNNSSSFQLNHETGYGDRTDSTGNTLYTNLSCAHGGHSLNIPGPLHLTGFTHVHIDEYIDSLGVPVRPVKMFSPGDIRTFSESIQEGAIFNNVSHLDTYGIMLTSEGIFAIKMLTPIPTTVNIDWDEIIKDYKEEIELLKEFDNLQTDDLKKMFLKLMKKHNLENNIGLFEGKMIPEISDTPIWSKLYLEGNKVKKTPC